MTPAISQPVAQHVMPSDIARATSLADRISLAVAWALRTCPLSREEVALRMSRALGQVVSVHMLAGYASQAREDHRITLERFIALVEATGRLELLGFVCGPFGAAAVPASHVELIELELIEAELRAIADRRREAVDRRRIAS